MSGRLLIDCPQCGDPWCEADGVDNGVGMQQCGPYCCEACGYVQPCEIEELLPLEVDDEKPFG
jgi:hypothetical protein